MPFKREIFFLINSAFVDSLPHEVALETALEPHFVDRRNVGRDVAREEIAFEPGVQNGVEVPFGRNCESVDDILADIELIDDSAADPDFGESRSVCHGQRERGAVSHHVVAKENHDCTSTE